ncbi:MAG: hypothetical protein IJA73_02385 [Oscillospiraceae bacterium]|nr:hypothetical protein [Oscillospiraceae bacterium]
MKSIGYSPFQNGQSAARGKENPCRRGKNRIQSLLYQTLSKNPVFPRNIYRKTQIFLRQGRGGGSFPAKEGGLFFENDRQSPFWYKKQQENPAKNLPERLILQTS